MGGTTLTSTGYTVYYDQNVFVITNTEASLSLYYMNAGVLFSYPATVRTSL